MRKLVAETRPASTAVLIFLASLSGCDDPTGPGGRADLASPVVALVSFEADTLAGTVVVSATATDDVGVTGVAFRLNGITLGDEDREPPYEVAWDTWTSANGIYSVTARARDAAGHSTTSEPLRVVVRNVGTIEVTIDVNDGGTVPGSDPDGFQVVIDGTPRGTVPGRGGTLAVGGFGPGAHRVEVAGLSFNCTAQPAGPVPVTLDDAGPLPVRIPVTCAEAGSAHVIVDVGGHGYDPDGFVLVLDGTERDTIPGHGGEARLDLLAGTHSVQLSGLFRTCSFDPVDPIEVRVEVDQVSEVSLAVTCDRLLSQSVAFAQWQDDGQREVFRFDFDRTGLHNLTNSPSDDFDPSWSPDGSRIAFVSTRDDPRGEIYLMDADGSNLVRLTDNQSWESLPRWSPDGSRIAFACDETPSWYSFGDNPIVFVMNADGTGRQQLSPGGDGVRDFPGGWTPDGSAILTERYSNTSGTSDLYSLAADGSLFQPLGPLGGYGGTGANVSPDGQRIVYSQEITDWYYIWSSEIVVLNADGTGRTVITATEGVFEASPVWTADGRILFTEWVDAGNQISIMDADGSNRELLLAEVGEQLTLSP
jgi:hypothetical protein